MKNDFIDGPNLLSGHSYHSFIDIGFNMMTIDKFSGEETSKTQEGVALIDEFKGKIAFIELQVKVVQKQGQTSGSVTKRPRSRSGSRGKSPAKVANPLSYEGTAFEPKVLFCNLSTF